MTIPYNPLNNPNMIGGYCQTGWKCPQCNRVYSPSTSECWSCNSKLSFNNPMISTTDANPIGYCPPNTGFTKEAPIFDNSEVKFPNMYMSKVPEMTEDERRGDDWYNPNDKKDK